MLNVGHRLRRSKSIRSLALAPFQAQRFAARLCGRYRMGGIANVRAAMPLLIDQAGVATTIVQHRHEHGAIHYAPRVNLSVLLQYSMKRVIGQARADMAPAGEQAASVAFPLVEMALSTTPGETLAERLSVQHRRIETRLPPPTMARAAIPDGVPSGAHAVATASSGLVDMVLARPAIQTPASATPRSADLASTERREVTSGKAGEGARESAGYGVATPPKSAEMNEREVEQLADRVIRSIDRRIVAQRERLGRF